MTYFKQDWIAIFNKLNIKANMTVCVSGDHPAFAHTINQHAAIIEALVEQLGYDGTLIYMSKNQQQREPAWDLTVPVAALNKIREELVHSEQRPPLHDLFALALLVRKDVIVQHSGSVSFYAIGKYARFITRKVPNHFPFGDRGPLKACIDLKATVLHFGEEINSCYPLYYYQQNDISSPIMINGGVIEEDGVLRWQKFLDRVINEQSIFDYLNHNQANIGQAYLQDQPIVAFPLTSSNQ